MLEQIAAQGLGVLPELVRIVINTAMQAEREAYLSPAATPELFYTQTGYVVDVNFVLANHSK